MAVSAEDLEIGGVTGVSSASTTDPASVPTDLAGGASASPALAPDMTTGRNHRMIAIDDYEVLEVSTPYRDVVILRPRGDVGTMTTAP